MPRSFQIFSQSDYLIQIFYINSHTEWQTVQIQINWLLRSQLIWIYIVCKGRVYPGSAGQELMDTAVYIVWTENAHIRLHGCACWAGPRCPHMTWEPIPHVMQQVIFPLKKKKKKKLNVICYNDTLTLKMPGKPASENAVCLCPQLNILANFSNLFLQTGKQCGPRSDCS